MYLLDTSIIVEFYLQQKKAYKVEEFLERALPGTLYISEFTLYSPGIILIKLKMSDIFLGLKDDLIAGRIKLGVLQVEELDNVVNVNKKFGLDFDDAYQYAVAEKYNLTIMSFDKDFDKTEKGRKEPE